MQSQNKKSLFAQNEEEVLRMWAEKNIFQKTLEKKSPKGNFVFFEGPPTANGRPGIHHILARSFKDIILRFRTMQGYHVERKAGWDTHGLPVELQVEKELGISGKPEIEKYGVEEFNQKCQESVWKYQDEWEKLTRRIGFWLDLEHPYVTYRNDYIESLWWIFKEIDKRGLVYKGYKVVPQCPRCGTALSSHEVAQGYKNVEDTSVYVKFKVKEQDKTFILSWTTTPWTLPGNVGLAVGSEIVYVKVKHNDEFYILAKTLVEQVLDASTEIVEEFKGQDLEGLEYEPLFPGVLDPQGKKAWFVGTGDFVSTVDGTGIVHTAVMYGEDDFNFGEKYNLPFVHTVDENGHFLPMVKNWAGQFVKNPEVEKGIIEDLKSRGLFLAEEKYAHDYPFCWRCDSPLLYYAKDSWFIKISAVQKDLLKNNEKINWVPDYIKEGRFGEWLSNIRDWAISRQRYWGTPLPIWICEKCDQKEIIGSLEELQKRAGALPKNKDGEVDLHRPFIDNLKFVCSCGGEMKRISDVFDCWYDSGAMPFAQYHYPFENKNLIDKGEQFPADFISEAIDQTRGWFYTLLAVSTLLGQGAPYKNVICLGHIRDKEGKKMSKSKGNVVDPWMIADKFGVDALRMYLFSLNQPGEPKNFDEKEVEEILRKVIMLLGNVMNFYEMYKKDTAQKYVGSPHLLDKWIIAKFFVLIKDMNRDLDCYHVFEASRRLIDFINELSTWYVRRSRERLKGEGEDKENCAATLRFVLENLVKLLAPFMPFVSERFYARLDGKEESVHLDDWPLAQEEKINWEILKEMELARKIVELGLSARAEKTLKVRQPLSAMCIANFQLNEELIKIISEELNIKEVRVVKDFSDLQGENWLIKIEGTLSIALNIKIDEQLKAEGMIREIVRALNQLRKNAGLTIKDQVVMTVETADGELQKVIKDSVDILSAQVLAKEIILGKVGEKGFQGEVEGKEIKVNFS